MVRWLYIIALLTLCLSCSHAARNISFEGLEVVEDQVVEVTMVNTSAKEVVIEGAELRVYIKGSALISFALEQSITLPPNSRARYTPQLDSQSHDAATIYALRRRPLHSYIDRLTFDYSIRIGGEKAMSKRNIKGKRVARYFENIENILR